MAAERPSAAAATAVPMLREVLPTPPFWAMTAITFICKPLDRLQRWRVYSLERVIMCQC